MNCAPPIVLQPILPAGLTVSVTGATTNDFIQRDGMCSAFLIVSTVTGTGGPALDSRIEMSDDLTTWTVAGTFDQITTSTTQKGLNFQRTGRYMRAVNIVAGTTSPRLDGMILVFEMKKQVPVTTG